VTETVGASNYIYDKLDRLTDDQAANDSLIEYTYDRNGNRTSRANNGSRDNTSLQLNTNLMISDGQGTVTHDAAGNLTSDRGGNRTYSYTIIRAVCGKSMTLAN